MSIAKGEVKVDVQTIVGLEQKIEAKDQIIGAQRETLQISESKLQEAKEAHSKAIDELTEKLGKEVRIVTGDDNNIYKRICPSCGYKHSPGRIKPHCYMCGGLLTKENTIVYKGLDDVVDMIRKEEGKKIKADVLKLEESNDNLSFELAKAEKELKKLNKQKEFEITEAKTRLRERLNKIIEGLQKDVEHYKEEIEKVKDSKTNDEIEALRKQEIIDLKMAIEEAKTDRDNLLAMVPKFLRKRFEDKKAKQDALVAKTKQDEKIENISNQYPTVTKGRYGWKNRFQQWNVRKTFSNTWGEMVNIFRSPDPISW